MQNKYHRYGKNYNKFRHSLKIISKAIFVFVLLLNNTLLYAQQPGTLVNNFGNRGRNITKFDTLCVQHIYDLDVDLNGKIIIGGAGSGDYFLARLNLDGNFDTSFCYPYGYKSISADRSTYFNMKLAPLPNGKLIVVINKSNKYDSISSIIIQRYNSDSSIDSTFGINGSASFSDDNNQLGLADIKVSKNNKILILYKTRTYYNYMGVIRFNENGSPDTNFSNNGMFIFDSLNKVFPKNLILTDEGKILISFNYDIGGQLAWLYPAIIKLNENGSYDPDFGENGIQHIKGYIHEGEHNRMCLDKNNNILLAGYFDDSLDCFQVLRLHPDGSYDSTFNNLWLRYNGSNSVGFPLDILIDSSSNKMKLYTSGYITQLDNNGNVDSTFGSMGTIYYPHMRMLKGVKNKRNRDVILINDYTVEDEIYPGIMLLDSLSQPEKKFGNMGKKSWIEPSSTQKIYKLENDKNRKIIAMGQSRTITNAYSPTENMIVRYSKDGQVDRDFGLNGRIITSNFYNDIKPQQNGYIVSERRYLSRIFETGERDISFGIDGEINLSDYDYHYFFEVLETDDILLITTSKDSILMIKYDKNGKILENFGNNGIVRTGIYTDDNYFGATNCIIQKDGKILITGYYDENNFFRRYLSDGAEDVQFNSNVSNVIDTMHGVLKTVKIQNDDKILLGTNSDTEIFRFYTFMGMENWIRW